MCVCVFNKTLFKNKIKSWKHSYMMQHLPSQQGALYCGPTGNHWTQGTSSAFLGLNLQVSFPGYIFPIIFLSSMQALELTLL